ncbi:MAG TPA: hypothetical protein VLA71_19535 [Algoriphagus sp.]|nr:hypothetical protein [Algoriphagus sp.]
MKLKAFKIWLFLLPIVAIIAVMLFVQSTNNLEELEQQHIRSIASNSKDIQLALPDYLKRVDAHLLREGYASSSTSPLSLYATQLQELLKGFQPQVTNLRFIEKENLPETKMTLDSTTIHIKNQPVTIPPIYKGTFLRAVSENSKFAGVKEINSVLLMDISIPIQELFDRLLANDFIFEKFYLTNSEGMVLYPEESAGNKLFDPSLLKQDTVGLAHAGITFSRILVDENEYQAYSNPIYLGPNRLYFVGLYDSDYFLKVGLRINFNLLSTLLLILILIITSIPILGVVRMGRGDSMTQSRIIQVGISLMTIAVVIGFSLSFSRNRPIPSDVLKENIAESGKILKTNLAQFEYLPKNWVDNESIAIPHAIPDLSNELILTDAKTGYVKEIVFIRKNGQKPLWISFDTDTSFIYLKDRPYISYFSNPDKNSTFLGSHYSRGTGLLETVISYQDPVSSTSNIKAVTFSLKLDDKYSSAHRILLIKEDGKVIFKSKKVESSISNLSESINPDKWKEVSSLLKNNRGISESKSLYVPLYLNGHQYEALFQRIDTKDYDTQLWQVFLVNTNIFHAFSALSSLEGVIFLGFYFSFFLFTLFAQWSTRSGSNSKGFKSFLFEWLVPSEKNQPRLNFLIVSYAIFAGILLTILKTTSLNPFSTLALLTFSSLCISVINMGSAQVGDIKTGKKISTELLVLSAIVVATFILIAISFKNLFWGMAALFLTSILIIFVWSRLRPKKDNLPILNFIKSSKSALSAYLVFWFFLIGFLPGYLIQSKTQQFESTIWNQPSVIDPSLNSESPVSTLISDYEKARRNVMATLGDPFDSKIQDFIAPSQQILLRAWEGSPSHFSKNPAAYLGFALLILGTYVVIRWIQSSIFFDLKPETELFTESGYAPNYICCINSNQVPAAEENTEIIDLKYRTFPEDFIPKAKYYRLTNFHCVENLMTLIRPIAEIKNSRRGLTIYSGALWKNLYNGLKSEREKTIFSELFSDFKFSVIRIEDVVNGSLASEDEVLARLKRNKAFYTNIWSDLCFEEKLVCNSYSKEGFFNPAQKETMQDLAQKGIIVPKNNSGSTDSWIEWRLFSSVFRQYILTHSSEEEAAKFGAYEKKHGNVRTIQTAVISFVLICIALVGIFDKTFFNEAYAYLTGGLGVLGTLYSFLNQGFAGLRGAKKEG